MASAIAAVCALPGDDFDLFISAKNFQPGTLEPARGLEPGSQASACTVLAILAKSHCATSAASYLFDSKIAQPP
jgi:hypothetical protein